MKQRKTVEVLVGNVGIGRTNPVRIQSMTNTDTTDADVTSKQIVELAQAGSELVRITVNTKEAAKAVPHIIANIRSQGIEVPIIGDFHYNGHLLLSEFPDCAKTLDKYRVNPGNVGVGNKRDFNFIKIIEIAITHGKAIRIGVNWGSLDQSILASMMDENAGKSKPKEPREIMMDALVTSALRSAALAEEVGLSRNRIILSAKVSGVRDLIDVYRNLSEKCEYPLHLGLTEAGMGIKGIIASSAAFGVLLHEGIGNTIRVSLTPSPGGDRSEEVRVAQQILQSLEIRSFIPQVTSCPGCGRTTSTLFQELASQIQKYITYKMPEWKQNYKGVEELKVAVMGCVVNGPGESKHADIGISLPGSGEEPKAPVYIDGKLYTTLKGESMAAIFSNLIDDYVKNKYSPALVE